MACQVQTYLIPCSREDLVSLILPEHGIQWDKCSSSSSFQCKQFCSVLAHLCVSQESASAVSANSAGPPMARLAGGAEFHPAKPALCH